MRSTWIIGEDKRIEERAHGTAGILGREDPNLDLERQSVGIVGRNDI
jgi:hypothetical protein